MVRTLESHQQRIRESHQQRPSERIRESHKKVLGVALKDKRISSTKTKWESLML